jgi:hypothetical protein
MGNMRNDYKILVGKWEGNRPFGRPRRRWEDNIKVYYQELGYADVHWIHLAQNRNQ